MTSEQICWSKFVKLSANTKVLTQILLDSNHPIEKLVHHTLQRFSQNDKPMVVYYTQSSAKEPVITPHSPISDGKLNCSSVPVVSGDWLKHRSS